MGDGSNSFDASLARIEAALGRIERAASGKGGNSGDLNRRHEQLKAAVARSLEELDDLIADQKE